MGLAVCSRPLALFSSAILVSTWSVAWQKRSKLPSSSPFTSFCPLSSGITLPCMPAGPQPTARYAYWDHWFFAGFCHNLSSSVSGMFLQIAIYLWAANSGNILLKAFIAGPHNAHWISSCFRLCMCSSAAINPSDWSHVFSCFMLVWCVCVCVLPPSSLSHPPSCQCHLLIHLLGASFCSSGGAGNGAVHHHH